MKTWTQKVKDWNKMIQQKKIGPARWVVLYRPQYRYLSLSGDGLLAFRGTISMDGQKILITCVNVPCDAFTPPVDKIALFDFDDEIFNNTTIVVGKSGRAMIPLQGNIELTPEQFEYAIVKHITA